MLKYLFTLTLLAQLVFCRVSPEERQWEEGDNRQNCTILCEDECRECLEPTYCDENEIKCGEAALPGHEDCPKNDVCIPDNCNCKQNVIRDLDYKVILAPDTLTPHKYVSEG